MQLASESFLTVFVSMALQKNSRHTDTINRGYNTIISIHFFHRIKLSGKYLPVIS
jgi:hypothetical protein